MLIFFQRSQFVGAICWLLLDRGDRLLAYGNAYWHNYTSVTITDETDHVATFRKKWGFS